MSSDVKRLYKSRSDRMIDGVCGGVAEYVGLDATLVRIGWVFLTLLGGSGILLYLLAMFVMPANPQQQRGDSNAATKSKGNQKFWGFILVGMGVLLLLSNLGVSVWHHWWGLSWDVVLGVILILAGVAFLFGGRNYVSPPAVEETTARPEAENAPSTGVTEEAPVQPRRLYRSRDQRKLFGVCGGLAEYLSIDPTIVRLLLVVAAIASFGFALVLYFLMAIVIPDKPLTVVPEQAGTA